MTDRTDKGRNKVQVVPEPKRPDLFAFISKLFEGDDQFAERIDVRQAFGPGARKYGATVDFKEFKPNSAKPDREALVALSNRFLEACQINCNAIGKPHRYGILAKHHAKSDTYYAVFVVAMQPTQEAEYDPTAVDDDDDVVPDPKRRDALLSYALDHIKQADENERWRQDQHSTSTGDIIERYKDLVTLMITQNIELIREHRELFKTADEALSKKLDRELAIESQQFKHEMLSNAFQFLRSVAPIALQKFNPNGQQQQQLPGETITESSESLGVRTFLEGLSETQAKALFGNIDEKGNLKGDGVFSVEQIDIFAGVSQCRYPADVLDKIIPGGEYGVTDTQIAAAMQHLGQTQAMPLYALMINKKKGS